MNVRELQAQLIRDFLEEIPWEGRVLDYGCDLAPYRSIVEASGAEWHGYNRVFYPSGHKREDVGPDEPLHEAWDMILCTQVFQYVPNLERLLARFASCCDTLVATYATNWPEVEQDDLFRYTASGMEHMLRHWTIERHQPICYVPLEESESMALGYGVVAHPAT